MYLCHSYFYYVITYMMQQAFHANFAMSAVTRIYAYYSDINAVYCMPTRC